ncbi:putative SNF2 family helicase [Aspergillus vadensis CBS 113365]|uniref:SNF2 family helicase n=1 Tax=Aspergillus vadensis (strain CBS 113365 / IMI 142717 / IBT 24658) TaxID=1448311 RepID=A0A319BKM1_ASPVC|nr:SNF2 family helicase [Aspergillus vadensis CBS 113365]PYH72881.1 SNF2 family helicase [Aspergillus vadensis CBS 113365]
MEGSSEGLEPPKVTQEAAAGSEDVQEPDEQGSSLQFESFDPKQILLEAIDRRRQQYNPRQAFLLSNLGFDIHNPVRHTGNSPSEFLPVPNDQVPAAQTVFDESLFVPQEEYSSLYLPPSGPDVPLVSPDDQNILELLQGPNPEGDPSPPVQQHSQNVPHSSVSASQTGNAGTIAAPVEDEEDPRLSAPSCVDLISSSSSATGNTDVPVEDFPDDAGDQSCPTEWRDEELEASTRAELSKAKFNTIKKWFNGDLSFSDIDEPNESTSKQTPTEQKTESSNAILVKPQPKRRRQNRISAEEKRKSKELSLAVVLARQKKREMPKRAPRKRKDRAFDNGMPGPSKRPKRRPLGTKKYLESLLSSGVVEDAHVSASLDAIPASIDKNKMKALKRLVATIPSVDQKEAKSDKKKILEATRKFTCSPRSDGKLGWNIKGMKTSLYHYQLLGAAFMRDRESSSEGPFGGLLCDIMGFGKTIQALANIVDGKPSDPEDPEKTTLIVVPSHLVTHWKTQINRHCDEKAIGDVLIYKASSRLESLNTVGSLAKYDVIITTYDEVRRSYPPMKLTDSMKDDEKLSAWWDQSFDTEIGPLHKIKFHRIILDEGHTIKNHISSVSIAVRSLTGHYKWILSGTPVHNHLEEFYPLFDFLGVPGIKDAGIFIKNFCSDDEGHDRLVNLLRAFLFRRTHKSRLFSLPVIKLPDVNERIVRVQFCAVERELYNAISEVFIENINGCAHLDQPKLAQYRCFLSMILMLLQWLSTVRKNTTVLNERNDGDTGQYATELHGDETALAESFRQLMDELHLSEIWEERLERTNCPICKSAPVNPVITSCRHLYCEECYYSLRMDKDKMLMEPKCVNCCVSITEAAYCKEEGNLKTQPASIHGATFRKEKQRQKRTTTKKQSRSSIRQITAPQADETDEEPDADEDTDWIRACAQHMPSAKLTKIREVLTEWLTQESSGKIVIFTQFLDFVEILSTMCEAEGWPFVLLTGKLGLSVRENNMKTFSDRNSEVRILIASLKAGGIGLDLSAANKCILVDLWWNEAIQEQAFCRLFRIGQESEVEFVKLIVDNSIDDYLLKMQTHKTAVILGAMGDGVLAGRDTIEDLLRMFADVEKDSEGVLHLRAKTASRDIRIGAGFPPSFGIF